MANSIIKKLRNEKYVIKNCNQKHSISKFVVKQLVIVKSVIANFVISKMFNA